MNTATLDSSAIITLFNQNRQGHDAMRRLRAWANEGRVRLVISRRTLYELRKKDDEARRFAERIEILPYYAVGAWEDLQGVTWGQLAGTWDDVRRMDGLQKALPVRRRVKIRDRGMIIDSMLAGVHTLVTTDSYIYERAEGIKRVTGVLPVHPGKALELLRPAASR